jgi:predicted Zn-dependent protease
MPVVRDAQLNDYVSRIGRRLASAPEADRYPYTFKVINESSINAFALPGGPTYVHTGLIRAAENEAQLAGVMAHEIAHVALRHGTHQASKANAVQLPAMILGGILGGGGSMLGQLAQLGIGVGANSLLLKYSRDAERDADRLGARMMAQAGYNPLEMARFFEKLQAQGSRGGPAFLSSHPDPGNRIQIVQEEISYLPRRNYTDGSGGDLQSVQSRIGSLPAASSRSRAGGGVVGQGDPRPSGGLREYRGNGFSIAHPSNWEVFGGDGGSGGVAVGYGVIASYANAYHEGNLRSATDDLLGQLRQSNPGMQVSGRQQSTRVDGRSAMVTTLSNQSPLGGREIDMLVTVQGADGLFYMVFIAPEGDYRSVQSVYEQMLRSVRLR